MELNLIRKIAWSFHKTTGIEYDELFSEACLAYVREKQNHDPVKSEFSTFIWNICRNHLITYCQEQYREKHARIPEDFEPGSKTTSTEETVFFLDTIENLSQEAQTICQMIFESPTEYLSLNRPKFARGYLKDKLRKMGWTWESIWDGFREIKNVLNETR